jgi:parallel beta-helix repeat protein
MKTNASWLSFSSNQRLFGTPTTNDIGPYWVYIEVSDGYSFDSTNFTLTVSPYGKPIITTTDVSTAYVNESYYVKYSAIDSDTPQNNLTWTMKTNASWLNFSSNQTLFGTPSIIDIGTFWVYIKVSDGNLSDSINFTLTVNKRYQPPPPNIGPIQNLRTGKRYLMIQKAIDDAKTNDTIRVYSGTYKEKISVYKTVTIIGNGSSNTTIDSSKWKSQDVVRITANYCEIKGFTIIGNGTGIYISSDFNNIEDCYISGTGKPGIYLHNADHNEILDSESNSNSNGIILYSSTNNRLTDIKTKYNAWAGITVGNSNFNTIDISESTNNLGLGIQLRDGKNNLLINNTLKNNKIEELNVSTNSKNNNIYHNNFLNDQRKIKVTDDGSSNKWNTTVKGNYWSDWNSPDKNNDGIVDISRKISGKAGAKDFLPISISSDLVALWHMDENSGNIAYDETINNNDGIINGPSWTIGKNGSGLNFSGGGKWHDGDGINVKHSKSLDLQGNFSIDAWIKPKGNDNLLFIVDKYYHNEYTGFSYGYSFLLENGKLRLVVYPGSKDQIWVYGKSDLRDDTWHHVIGVFNGTHILLYVDGVKENEKSWNSPPASTTNDLCIGKRKSGWGGFGPFLGKIDEVAIWSRALTIPETRGSKPIITNQNVLSAFVGQNYSVNYSANDPDTKESDLKWTMNTNGSWLKFSSNQQLYGTPSKFDVGNYWVCIKVSDGNNSYFTNFTINVKDKFISQNKSHSPRISSSSIGNNSKSVNINTSLIAITFSKSMEISSLEDALSISPSTNYTLYWINETTMHIVINEDLNHNTTYVIEIEPTAKDSLDNGLDGPFELIFTTKEKDISTNGENDPNTTDPEASNPLFKNVAYFVTALIIVIIVLLLITFMVFTKKKNRKLEDECEDGSIDHRHENDLQNSSIANEIHHLKDHQQDLEIITKQILNDSRYSKLPDDHITFNNEILQNIEQKYRDGKISKSTYESIKKNI